MNQELRDIQYLLCDMWMNLDNIGKNLFEDPILCILAERYGFTFNSKEEIENMIDEYIMDM